jgi:hypothetical protein
MPIPGKFFSLRLGPHYAVEVTIYQNIHRPIFIIQGEVFSRIGTPASVRIKNRVASAQFLLFGDDCTCRSSRVYSSLLFLDSV